MLYENVCHEVHVQSYMYPFNMQFISCRPVTMYFKSGCSTCYQYTNGCVILNFDLDTDGSVVNPKELLQPFQAQKSHIWLCDLDLWPWYWYQSLWYQALIHVCILYVIHTTTACPPSQVLLLVLNLNKRPNQY